MKRPASELHPEAHYLHINDSRMRVTDIDEFVLPDGTVTVEVTVADRFVGIFELDELVEVELT